MPASPHPNDMPAAAAAPSTKRRRKAASPPATPAPAVPDATAQPPAAPGLVVRFSTLPSFKLDVLASITARHGELLYQRLFGLRIVECRVLGVVAHYGPVTLRQTCIEIGIDKSQGSRLVQRLLQAGLLDRRDDPADQRSFYLLLTAAGQQMHNRIAQAAVERNTTWMAGLPPAQQAGFVDNIALLTRHAQQLLADESARSGAGSVPTPLHEQAEPVPAGERPLVVSPAALRALYRQLGELLGMG